MKLILHCHHELLFEPAYEPLTNRIAYIKAEKPEEEIPVRLNVIRYVTKKETEMLPKRVLKKAEELYKAWEEWEKAREAREAREKAREEVWGKEGEAWEAYDKAYDKAWEAWAKAWKAWDKTVKSPAMEKWHKKVCKPDCPWNGETLFPNS
jgi:hypothetical protein